MGGRRSEINQERPFLDLEAEQTFVTMLHSMEQSKAVLDTLLTKEEQKRILSTEKL